MRREAMATVRRSGMAIALALGACGGPTGELTVLLEAEDTITEGIDPGDGLENLVDGWQVRFTKYVVSVGDVRLERRAESLSASDPSVHVVDLARLGASGHTLATFETLPAGRWDVFAYATTHPTASALRHESVSEEDFDAMVANEWAYLIEGTLTNPSGQSCPPGGSCRDATEVRFSFGVPVETVYGPCEAEDGLPGVIVTEAGAAASVTFHGDHPFFDGFPSGAEVISRRAQWLADADADADGTVTEADLEASEAAGLFPTSLYNLAGAPIPIDTGWDYLRAQLATQGHFQGEGECPWTFDGAAGAHDHP